MRTDYDEVFDARGKLVNRTEVQRDDLPPDPRETALAAMQKATTAAQIKAAMIPLIATLVTRDDNHLTP